MCVHCPRVSNHPVLRVRSATLSVLEYIASQREALSALQQQHPLTTAGAFFVLYVALTGLSLPGAAVLTLTAGAVFSFLPCVLLVSFASSLGATLAFSIARYLSATPYARGSPGN